MMKKDKYYPKITKIQEALPHYIINTGKSVHVIPKVAIERYLEDQAVLDKDIIKQIIKEWMDFIDF